jgi:hypothetical protein
MTMKHNCPYCGNEIPKKLIYKLFASMGGAASKRSISPDQQAALQAARKAKKKPQSP